MYDAATVLLREYYRATGWNEQRSYSHLTTACDSLLDFRVARGVLFASESVKDPGFLASARVCSSPWRGTLGYAYARTANAFQMHSVHYTHRRMERGAQFLAPDVLPAAVPAAVLLDTADPLDAPLELADARSAAAAVHERCETAMQGVRRDMLLLGHLHVPTTYVDGVFVARLSPHWQLQATALSRAPRFPLQGIGRRLGLVSWKERGETSSLLERGTTNLQLALQRQSPTTTTEYTYSVDDALWGLCALHTITPPPELANGTLSAGAELFVSVAEKSAGVSLGMRYAQALTRDARGIATTSPSVTSVTVNPMMGHVRASYVAQTTRHLALCAR